MTFKGIVTSIHYNGMPIWSQSTSATKLEDVVKALREFKDMQQYRDPTEYQLEWARANGFPGWPSFKVGFVAFIRLQEMRKPKSADPSAFAFGIPITIDPDIHPQAVLDVRTEWLCAHPGAIL